MVSDTADTDGIDHTVSQSMDRSAQIIEAVVAMDSGHDGRLDLMLQEHTHKVGTRSVAMDDIERFRNDHSP